MNDGQREDHVTRRELYRRRLPDICADISQSATWRARLFGSAFGEKIRVDCETIGTERPLAALHQVLCEYDLAFNVSKVPHREVPRRHWAGY